jgi:conjugative relaxase-like TrwC/TraI family protein
VLSIGSAQGSYYASLSAEDYYHKGGEPEGLWHGLGAKELGLSGTVDKAEFLKLCDGFSPDGEPFTQNAGKDNHRAGWDLTFSAPKSVSVLWSQADEETRHKIQAAQLEAVQKTIDYLEAEAGYTRRGKAGIEIEKCKLVVATFEHGTSRAQDPQLHTHAVVLNVGIRSDGTTGALETKPIYQSKMLAGALYRAELANILRESLDVGIEKTKTAFEIKGVSKSLMEEFSKRREAILAEMEKAGAMGAVRAAHFTLTTREKKAHVARELLFEKWQEIGRKEKFSSSVVGQGNVFTLPELAEKKSVIQESVERLTSSQAYFSEKTLLRFAAEEAVGKLGIEGIKKKVSDYLENEAINLGRGRNGERYFTTPEIDALEKRMIFQVEAAKTGWHGSPGVFRETVASDKLNAEQKHALFSITGGSESSIKVVSGMAGTGKTTLLKSAREFWEAQGFEVRGAALAAVAAKGLEEGAGIKSETLHKTLFDIEKGNLRLTGKTVLVVDEAGMVGTRQMAELVEAVAKSKAQLVLVGDEKQLQPIEHGNPFKAIGEVVGRSELTDIRRQSDLWAREAVKDFAFGRAAEGLKAYAEKDLLFVGVSRKEAIKEMVSDWAKERTQNLKESLMLAGTKADVRRINSVAQEERIKNRELKTADSIVIDQQKVFVNDRIVFTKNKKTLGVRNGEFGTVKEIDPINQTIKIRLDNGSRVKISLQTYDSIQLGYAVTTHKAQGVTVDRSYILAGGSMQDRELSYVQMSRSRTQTKIYTERAEVGDTIAELSKTMNRSRQKDIAQEKSEQIRKENINERSNEQRQREIYKSPSL